MRRLRRKLRSLQTRSGQCTRLLTLLGLTVIATCAPEPESLDEAELGAGVVVSRPEGWTLKPHPAGGYKLACDERARVRELDLVVYPQDEVGYSSPDAPDIESVRGMLIAKRFEAHVLSETELRGLYQSFLAGYEFHSFEKLEVGGRTWGIHTQIRRGRKTQFWVTAFTRHANHYAVIVTFVDADAQERPPMLEEWSPHLSVLAFASAG